MRDSIRNVRGAASVAALLLVGCAAAQRPPAVAVAVAEPRTPRSSVYDRAGLSFANAVFYKPREPARGGPPIELAPLIVQESRDRDAGNAFRDRFGTARVSPDGTPWIDTGAPAVYGGSSTALIHGRTYEQVTWVWLYPTNGVNGGIAAQGVSMTLDTEGFPIVWEVLADGDGGRIVFVARSLEKAASAAFGHPLPGRRFATEPDAATRADVVVARLVDDGPVPMGPWVYLTAGVRSVGTLICRCSPSQVDRFVATVSYDVLPIEQLLAMGLGPAAWQPPSAFAVNGSDDPDRLERMLRLPPME